MNICYVGQFATSSVGEPEIANELENLGHEVFRLEEHETDAEEIKIIVDENGCEILLFAKFRIKNTTEEKLRLFDELRSKGIKIVTWVFDIFFGL